MALRLFEVAGKFFRSKTKAKKKRDQRIKEGKKNCVVKFGPDHPRHPKNRPAVGWNRGRHPKKAKGKFVK